MTDSLVDIDALLAGRGDFTRTCEIEIKGFDKKFVIHEFPSRSIWEVNDRISDYALQVIALSPQDGEGPDPDSDQKISEIVEERRLFYAETAIRFLMGHAYEPSETEINALLDNLGWQVIDDILAAGLDFNGETEAAEQAIAEK